ncbi:ornithine carbamoyltransferase [Azospirillum baldaniorum]|uniref:ornithine carbamoyltransferase n=1 Tax=Azospirillum baldaniorum TaxID=1064539 RepID=UPI0011A94B52|nr:ornithine carbamoyltransferase [Azospirillum baldaniorum]TWA62474.1 ornithine carbamoyltransferase [Azospirillum baldaniorum]
MSFNLRNRSLLTVQDYTLREFRYVLDLARDLKRAKYARTEQQHLRGKEICLIFEKTSTRTRCAFEVACHDQGANVTYLDPAGSQIGHKESFKDTARVLGRMYDAIEYRGAAQGGVEQLAKYAGVPVYNGLTDEYHPTQMLADVMTMREHSDKPITDITYAYVGDTRSNMGHSLMIVGCLMGMDVRICGPQSLWPSEEYTAIARKLAAASGARLTITDNTAEAVAGVDFIHTDVWVSMGEPKDVWRERIALLKPYQVNPELMAASGNPQVKFMHCLPAFHDSETTLGRQIAEDYGMPNGLEVTNEVFESEANIAFEQAENRMHTIKALLVATLGE